MAGLIKNQILKHLSRYAKNLSSDKINLSTFKGEGELRNLELDQEVMTELLALPTWMKLTHATCNHVLVRIPWTKLKSVPIHLSLDEVNIRVEACEELRTGSDSSVELPAASFGKYGFVNKVIDGITATVNSVEITFHSREFESKVQISRIRVESRAPDWSRVDLSGTRLKDMRKGETLIFKEMEWQTLRLEARSTSDSHLAPLRLLANQAKARIVIKKRLIDSQVLGCRLSLILDDLLWVFTDSQILAALHFMSSLSGLVKQATETNQRIKAARKLETLPEYHAQISQANSIERQAITRFDVFDVKETSYHFMCEKIDLHFCDDPGSGRSQHPDLKDGGALQLSLSQVLIDMYPYHLAIGSRKFWQKYSTNALAQWLQHALQAFKISLVEALSTESMHTPLSRTHPLGHGVPVPSIELSPVKEQVTSLLGKLMSSCLILKIQDFSLYRVTTSSKRTSPLPFISTFIERPKDLPVIHTELTWFYYPGEICFPLPSAKVYAYFHPIQINLDVCTILWLNTFATNLSHTMANVNSSDEPGYADVRVEMLMPKIIFENTCEYPGQRERPRSLHVQVSRLTLSNFRSTETGTLHQLTQCIEFLQNGDLVYGSSFPSKDGDVPLLQEKFVKHAEGRDKLRTPKKLNCSSFSEIAGDLTQDFLWIDPRDVWYIYLDTCWADFHLEEKKNKTESGSATASSKKNSSKAHERRVNAVIYPFIDSISVSAWIYVDIFKKTVESKATPKNIHALFSAGEKIKIQITHYQFIFLMRMVEAFSELSLYLTLDSRAVIGEEILKNLITFVGYFNTLEASLLFFPVVSEEKSEESVALDSADPDMCSRESPCERPEYSAGKTDLDLGKNSAYQKQSFSSLAPLTRGLVGGSNPNLESNLGYGFLGVGQNIKQSLTNLTVSFNKVGGISTPDSEIVSNWSNISSDSSDNFVQLDVGEPDSGAVAVTNSLKDCMELGSDSEIEVAVEVEENSFVEERFTPSPAAFCPDVSALKPENDTVISILSIRIKGMEVAQEGHGLSSVIKLQCKSVGVQEQSEISWKDFQTTTEQEEDNFCGRTRGNDDSNETIAGSPTQRRALKLRISQAIDGDTFLAAISSDETRSYISKITTSTCPRINLCDRPGTTSPIRDAIFSSTTANLEAHADFTNEPQIRLHTSMCSALADLLEDEILPNPLPMKIELVGLNFELTEDRPPANVTFPGSVPLRVTIPSLLQVSRDKTGVFQVGNSQTSSSGINTESNVSYSGAVATNEGGDAEKQYLKKELSKSQAQLMKYQLRNASLEQELEENECLKGLIVSLQEEVHKLQNDKLGLLKQYQHNCH